MDCEQILGLDVGKVRTGVARASSVAKLAEPLMTVKTEELIPLIQELVKQHGYNCIVVGLPRNLQGNETAQTEWVRHWVKSAKQQLKAAFFWQDEALTTRLAEAHKISEGKKMPHGTDALAAAIILQDFLDASEAERVSC
jgi:putative Holliday junction resolvase